MKNCLPQMCLSKIFKALFLCLIVSGLSFAQDNSSSLGLFEPSDTFNKKRFWTLTGTTTAVYTGVVIGLNELWYADYPKSKFHSFNDFGEWEDMDKVGHLYTAYFYSHWSTSLYKWTGMNDKAAAWMGFGASTILQTTIEVMDGFSAEWGFSWGDVGFNTAGSALYLIQDLKWKEQRILMKYSSFRRKVPDFTLSSTNGLSSITLQERTEELFGSSLPEILLKDYNATTIWASVNVADFIKKEESKFPKWLNVAVGYGAGNLYGGTDNNWEDDNGNEFQLNSQNFPRYRQFFLSLDVDLTKIETKSKFLKTLFGAVNIFKIPAPAIELNTLGKVEFHPFYF